MPHYRNLPARPRAAQSRSRYPRLLALGLAVAASACGGTVGEAGHGDDATGGTGGAAGADIGGGASIPFDGGTAGAAGMGGNGGAGGREGWAGSAGGGMPYPYDADPPPDAADEDAADAPSALDAGSDASDAAIDVEEPDAQLGGAAAESFASGS